MICAHGHNHEDLKRDAARWAQLKYIGIQSFGGGDDLELRNCACGSTLAVPIDTTSSQAEAAA
jgi:hypothetical protein